MSVSEAKSFGAPGDDNYSILDQLESGYRITGPDTLYNLQENTNYFQLALRYPCRRTVKNYNIWKQTHNPVTASEAQDITRIMCVEGYDVRAPRFCFNVQFMLGMFQTLLPKVLSLFIVVLSPRSLFCTPPPPHAGNLGC
jgi:hypothetical protein